MVKKSALIVLLFITVTFTAFSENYRPSFFSFKLTPGAFIPVGQSSDLYKFGFGLELAAEYALPARPLVFFSGNAGYTLPPLQADTSLSLISFGAGSGVNFNLGPKLGLKGYANGGVYYGFLHRGADFGKSTAINPYFSVGTGIHYLITPAFSLGTEVSYRNYIGLYNGVGIAIGTAYHIKASDKTMQRYMPRMEPILDNKNRLEVKELEFDAIFPVFFKYYDDHPVGKVVLRNNDSDPITDIRLNFFVKQYMDIPKECSVPDQLEPGEEQPIELKALFNENVLEITEGTKVAAEILLEFSIKGVRYKDEHSETLRLYDRNATTWEDDRKAAAFVTAKDPVILKFSKNVVNAVKNKTSGSVNENLLHAIALHEAIAVYGMSYVVDPKTPYKEFSRNKQAVDFLQFPKQTLEYRAGDCDDLSIMYSALLEAVGIETAFITIPGHILMAFSLGMSPEEAKRVFSVADDLIFRDGKTWVPVEATQIEGGFLKAWQLGAKNWREGVLLKKEGFYPMHDSWTVYEPVGLPGEAEPLRLPSEDRLVVAYMGELVRFIDREIYPIVEKLQAEIDESGGAITPINKLGVLYARYGLMDRAEAEFKRVLAIDENYVPVLINLGNIHYLQNDMEAALLYYERAYRIAPDNSKVLLSVARANHGLENYHTVKKTYERLRAVDPGLAEKYGYLDLKGEEAMRAAEAGRAKGDLLWVEE